MLCPKFTLLTYIIRLLYNCNGNNRYYGDIKMFNYVYQQYSSQNPAGIVINLGWYALAECILTEHKTQHVLSKWCGIRDDDTRTKTRKSVCKTSRKKELKNILASQKTKSEKALLIYKLFNELSNVEIAKLVQCTPRLVTKMLRDNGFEKRNRWTGYISKDPRYSKEKRKTGGIAS